MLFTICKFCTKRRKEGHIFHGRSHNYIQACNVKMYDIQTAQHALTKFA